MRVVRVTRFGGPEVLVAGHAEDPVPGPGEVLVDVSAVSITFVDTQSRRGVQLGQGAQELPYVPSAAAAGRVSALGAGVDPVWLGRRVLGEGAYADRAVAAVADLIPIPEGVEDTRAAALLHDGGTALALIAIAGVRAGDRVLVEAAAGGLGSLLVELAHAAGAYVVGAARGADKLARAGAAGADAVVDYAEPEWTARVRELTDGVGPDVVFDGVGGAIGRQAFEVLAPRGRFSVHGAASGDLTVIDAAEAKLRGVTVIGIEQLFDLGEGMRERAARALDMAAAGRMTPVIGRTFPLERAADAHAAIEARAVAGKTLLIT